MKRGREAESHDPTADGERAAETRLTTSGARAAATHAGDASSDAGKKAKFARTGPPPRYNPTHRPRMEMVTKTTCEKERRRRLESKRKGERERERERGRERERTRYRCSGTELLRRAFILILAVIIASLAVWKIAEARGIGLVLLCLWHEDHW